MCIRDSLKDIQRDEYKSQTGTFEDVIMEDGFMDVIKVFPRDKKGYKIAEATHRVRALKNIFQNDGDPNVPIAILHWKDGDDEEEVKMTIMRFNNTGKVWTLYDYVKAHANTKYFSGDVSRLWREIHGNMKRLKEKMSNAVVLSIYTGERTGQTIVKDEDKAREFRLSSYEREVVDLIVARLDYNIGKWHKRYVPVLFLRSYVTYLRKVAKAAWINDIEKFRRYFQHTLVAVANGVGNKNNCLLYTSDAADE